MIMHWRKRTCCVLQRVYNLDSCETKSLSWCQELDYSRDTMHVVEIACVSKMPFGYMVIPEDLNFRVLVGSGVDNEG